MKELEAMLKINGGVGVVGKVGEVILAILGCGQDQATIQKALEALSVSIPENFYNTISNCTFVNEADCSRVKTTKKEEEV